MRDVFATAVFILLLPAFARAQEPLSSFDQLATSLKVGDMVVVTDKDGRQTRGRVHEITPSAVTVDRTQFAAVDITEIEKRVASRFGKPAAIGLGVGLTVGVLGFLGCSNTDAEGCAGAIPLAAGVGAGVGLAVGATRPDKMRLVYRAPGAQAIQFSVAPLIAPHAQGLAFLFWF